MGKIIRNIRNSLSAKVFLWIAGLLVVCSLTIYGIVMVFLPGSYTVVAGSRVMEEIDRLGDRILQTDYENVPELIEAFCRDNRASVYLDTGEETLCFGSVAEESAEEEEMVTSVLEVSFADREGTAVLSVMAPVSAGSELTGAFLELLPLLFVLILVIAALGAFFCSRVLVRPVLEISGISRRMAELDMTWECRVRSGDELGVLSASLNTMARKLERAMGELEDANRRMERANTKLENANQQLQEDMEHITELSRQRRDFFAAASHELKTPVTILKGQIESMILGIGKYKDTEKILPETLKEVENMERLVKEILSVSKVEMDGLAGKKETVHLTAVVEKVTEELRPLAGERKITFQEKTAEGVEVTGSESLLKKAVHNIMSNAVRHSPEGAEVRVALTETALTVVNTGTSIPEEDLPVLFTPFYRVEKSRNKATGGSGLGLYLVRSILELHGFGYRVENTGEGVKFTAEFGNAVRIDFPMEGHT